ncbi:AraC family transcriptional regulator [Clostridium massiliamazoniense]|uniref:AraC family transcriptional regulator n=1 Tax=Clostridium massiliamazoniense TaxID=1347366 RepID=UPI0006D82C87|nr:AraC family transcriptional regulator [Clostridium massiliamazoniense]
MNILEGRLENSSQIETEFLKISFFNYSKGYRGIIKSYENNKLCTILEGEKLITLNGKEYKCNSKNFIIIPAHSRAEVSIEKLSKLLVVEFTDSLVDLVKNKTSINFKNEYNYGYNKNVFNKEESQIDVTINRILEISMGDEKNKEFLLDLYSQELVYKLLNVAEINRLITEYRNNPINKAIEIMRNNILDKITIGDIANNLNMPITKFSSKFKAVTGITPNNYLRRLKLLEAKEMLKYKSVTEVSYDLGYENISHFIELFKKCYGITPKQYVLKNENL